MACELPQKGSTPAYKSSTPPLLIRACYLLSSALPTGYGLSAKPRQGGQNTSDALPPSPCLRVCATQRQSDRDRRDTREEGVLSERRKTSHAPTPTLHLFEGRMKISAEPGEYQGPNWSGNIVRTSRRHTDIAKGSSMEVLLTEAVLDRNR